MNPSTFFYYRSYIRYLIIYIQSISYLFVNYGNVYAYWYASRLAYYAMADVQCCLGGFMNENNICVIHLVECGENVYEC